MGGESVAGHTVLLNMAGGVCLLLFAVRMVRIGVMRAFGEKFRKLIGKTGQSALLSCLAGLGVAAALQSSSATGLIVATFVERNLIVLSAALAAMLGADIGSTLVVQSLSFSTHALIPSLMVAGFIAFMMMKHPQAQHIGRILIGLALMLSSLGMVVAATNGLRESSLFTFMLQRLGEDPFLAVVIAALLTWLAHSSVAFILMIVSLASHGLIDVALAVTLVIGANIGSGLVPLGLTLRASAPVRRVLMGNLTFRILGGFILLGLLPLLHPYIDVLGADPTRQIANAHTLFNITLALVFLPLTTLAASLLSNIGDDGDAQTLGKPEYLDDALLTRPSLALAAASREVMALANLVETMLREVILAFGKDGARRREKIKELDVPVDHLHEAIKLYLTRLMRQPLGDETSRKTFDLIVFTTNLEHIGDIIDKSLLELAAKMHRHHLSFSDEGWTEISELHSRVVEQMRLAITVFMTGDIVLARDLVAEKDKIRKFERQAAESHFARLRDGTLASIQTTALHLDIVRDLKRINAHITTIAYPILEASGEISESRLLPLDAEIEKAVTH